MIAYVSKLLKLPDESIEKLLNKFFLYFLLLTFITTVAGAYASYVKHHKWNVGDWLINYQGGLVRRGLSGELFYTLSQITHINPGFFAFLFQIVFYGVFFVFSYKLLKRQHTLLPYILLIVSPFIFNFQINNLGAGYRKEIIFFAILAYTVYAAKTYEHSVFKKIFYIMLLLYPAVILTHEMLAVYLPYLLVVYVYVTKITVKEAVKVTLLLMPSVIAFLIAIRYSGTSLQVEQIFASLTKVDYSITGGAIQWLDKPTSFGVNKVLLSIKNEHYLLYYSHIIILSILAYIPIRNNITCVIKGKLTTLLVLLSFIGSLVLCVVAIDWGRFIYINLIALFLLSLLYTQPTLKPSEYCYQEIKSLKNYCKNKINIYITVFFLVFYSQFWHIDHCCSPIPYSQVNGLLYLKPYGKIIREAFR